MTPAGPTGAARPPTGRAAWRLRAAVTAGRLTGAASRSLGQGGGTTLPGDVARAIDPGVLSALARQARHGTVLVSGTNGKTTTTALVRAAARASGRTVVANPSGANLVFGLTAAAVQAAPPSGKLVADWLVFEVDELSLPQAVDELQPRCLTLLNLYRDQLDRSFELHQVAARLQRAVEHLPAGAVCIANADDPALAALAAGAREVRFFGIDDHALARDRLAAGADARLCPRCGAVLHFRAVLYAHCGTYHCPGCGWARPHPDWAAEGVRLAGLESVRFSIHAAGAVTAITLPLGGMFSVANGLAAFATCEVMGVPTSTTVRALAAAVPAFGRGERIELEGGAVRLLLAKNPAGMDEALLAAVAERPAAIALGLNDGIADGRDVSWIWDADLSPLLGAAAPQVVVVTGTRAADLCLRLKYAGLPPERIRLAETPAAALDALLAAGRGAGAAPALLTYTAALGWYAELTRRGAVSPYWSRA